MAVTEQSYTGNGSTTNYSFTFPYLKSTDITVQVDAAVTTAWSLANATTVQFNSAPANGAAIKILRDTNVDNLTATFYAGSAIKSEDLNDNYTQNLYKTQEIGNRSFQNTGGTMTGDLTLAEDVTLIFEGATDDAYETTVTVTDPTADRTITIPNVTGTVVTTGDTGTVAHAMLAGDAVDGDNIADDSINSEHYVDGSIDEAHLASGIITFPKMAANSVASSNIVDDTIVNADIKSDAAIVFTKLENLDSAKILVGNGSNKATEVAVSGDVTIANTGAVTIATGAVETGMLAADAVTSAKLADDACDSEHYTDGSIDAEHLSSGSVTTVKLAADAVDSSKLADDACDSEHYTDGSIDEVHLAAGIVTHPKLAANSVASSNIVNDTIVDADIKSDAAISQGKIALDAELVTLAGMPSDTASILASATALTSTTAELNLLDGKSVVTSVSGSSTDVQLPTAKAVNDQIVAIVQDIGGFYPIDDELKFPNTNPDPNDDAGTIVSIADAGGIVVNGSGVSTTGRTLGGATVTINGIDSSLHSTTIAAGKGMLVQTTSTLNTYDYHRLIVDEAGVASAQTLVTDFNQRYQVAGSTPTQQPDGTALAEGDLFFDTGSNKMKVYDGSNYAEVTSVGDYKLLTVVNDGQTSGSPTYNGSIVSYDLRDGGSAASVTSPGQLLVSLNGVLQKPNSGSYDAAEEGFYLEGSNGIKFCTAPPSGSSIFITLIGSATTVNTPATNSVVEASIQTNVVSEEKLKISNAGSNGQFLSKQSGNSGGLTWASVTSTPEGTAILSTGESGGTKFLREDGDGSCSWQTVVGAVANNCIYENDQTISNDYTIASGKGAHSVGPLTVNATVTVNGVWVIS